MPSKLIILNFMCALGIPKQPRPRCQAPVPRRKLRRQDLGAAPDCSGRAGPGGAGRVRGGKLSKFGETPACPPRPCLWPLPPPSPRPSPRPPVLPSPPVHDGNTMAAAAHLSLTQVTPPAHPLGSVGRYSRPAPSPTALSGSPTRAVSPGPGRGGGVQERARVFRREGAIPNWQLCCECPDPTWGRWAPLAPPHPAPLPFYSSPLKLN